MVLENNLDIVAVAGNPGYKRIVEEFNNFLNKADVYDARRKYNNKLSEFTWAKYFNLFIARRFDHVLINTQMTNDALSWLFPKTYHKVVHIADSITNTGTRSDYHARYSKGRNISQLTTKQVH